MHDLLTWRSTKGHVFRDFEMLHAKIASALKRIITNQYFRRRINVEEQHAKNTTDFLEEDRLHIPSGQKDS